jgi:hypothetical protein
MKYATSSVAKVKRRYSCGSSAVRILATYVVKYPAPTVSETHLSKEEEGFGFLMGFYKSTKAPELVRPLTHYLSASSLLPSVPNAVPKELIHSAFRILYSPEL